MAAVEEAEFEIFHLSSYTENLSREAKERYFHKLSTIDIDCPYSIDCSFWLKDDKAVDILPNFTYIDLITYIMYSKSPYTKKNLKAYKSLDAYKRLTQQLFGSFEGVRLNNKVTVFRGKVGHSMAVTQTPLYPWVALAENGSVIGAHCTCPAG